MGSSQSKLKSDAKTLITSISLSITNEDLQFLILDYLGKAFVTLVLLYLIDDYADINYKYFPNYNYYIKRYSESELKKIRGNSKLKQEYKNYPQRIRILLSTLPTEITDKLILYKTHVLEFIIGYYNDEECLWLLYTLDYCSYLNVYAIWHYAAKYNNLDLCKLVHRLTNIFDDCRDWGIKCFGEHKNLDGVEWVSSIKGKGSECRYMKYKDYYQHYF